MKFNDSSLYLSLVRTVFERSIVPELQSPAAKGAASLIGNVLAELARRENGLPQAVEAANRDGESIANRMRALVGAGESQSASDGMATLATGFDAAAHRYAALSEDIAALAKTLRAKAPDSADARALLREAAEWEGNAQAAFVATAAPEIKRETATEPLPQAALERFLQSVHPAGKQLQVCSLDRIPGGFGKQTYRVEVADHRSDAMDKRQTLIVRKNDRMQVLFHFTASLEREFNLLKVVHAAGYPVPRPLWFGKQVADIDADFMVVEKLPGSMVGAFLEGANSRIPESQMLLLAELLARLHAIPLEQFSPLIPAFEDTALLSDSVEQCTQRTMAGWRAAAEQHGYLPSPLIDYVFNWLADNVPRDPQRPVLCHGDFGSHNILMENNQVTAVLDWEGAMFAAPEMDLAYAQPLVAKHIDWKKFLAHYLACGGRQPDPASMRYYLTFLSLRVALVGNVLNRNLQNGTTADIRYAMFELGLTPHFMQQMLQSTAHRP